MSKRIDTRIPGPLYKRLTKIAESKGVSLKDAIASAVSEYLLGKNQ